MNELVADSQKHKWLLRDDGKYECDYCQTVVDARTLHVVESIVKSNPSPPNTASKFLVCPKRKLVQNELNPIKEKVTLKGSTTPEPSENKEMVVTSKVKIPLGAVIDLEKGKIDIFDVDVSRIKTIALQYLDEDEFLLLEIRMRKKEGE